MNIGANVLSFPNNISMFFQNIRLQLQMMVPKPTATVIATVMEQEGEETISQIEEHFLTAELSEVEKLQELAKSEDFKADIVWRNVILFVILHVGALIGAYQLVFVAKWATVACSMSFLLHSASIFQSRQ
jgi:hypothetical protein